MLFRSKIRGKGLAREASEATASSSDAEANAAPQQKNYGVLGSYDPDAAMAYGCPINDQDWQATLCASMPTSYI